MMAKKAYLVIGLMADAIDRPGVSLQRQDEIWVVYCTSYDIRRGDYVIINDVGLATWPVFGQPIEVDGIGEVYADGEGGFTMRRAR